MSTSYRAISCEGSIISEAPSLDELIELMKAAPAGNYEIERISLDAASGEVRSWRQGTIIRDRRGRLKLDLPPWLD
jgi:hypothetical protein